MSQPPSEPTAPLPSGRARGRRPRDLSRMGLSDNKEARPRIIAWAPTEGVSAGPIIAALRSEGFIARIGSRREPAGNFEVEFKAEDADLVRDVILGIDAGAAPLTVGR